MAKSPRNESKTNLTNQHCFDMGAIREREDAIREKYGAYNKEHNKASSELSKVCAICTRPIIVTKDGIKKQCDDCVYKKAFQQRMEHVRQSLELNDNQNQ